MLPPTDPLAATIAAARAAHPGIDAPAVDFERHLRAHLPQAPTPEALSALRAADLYLAFACAQRIPAALAELDRLLTEETRLVLSRARGPRPDLDDFRQIAREKLLAADRPKIADYSGAGDLRAWLRVTLTRALIDLTRKRTETQTADEDRVRAIPTPEHDPELAYLKRLYSAQFRQAFEESALALSPEDRNLLRYHFAHGLTVDQIGALYNIHRSTAARRVAKARDDLLSGTRARLMTLLRIGRAELDSVMRMIESDLHLSLHRLFDPQDTAQAASPRPASPGRDPSEP